MESVKFQITLRYPADKDLIEWKQNVSKGDAAYTIREALRRHLNEGNTNTLPQRKKAVSRALDGLEL